MKLLTKIYPSWLILSTLNKFSVNFYYFSSNAAISEGVTSSQF